jgi:hypothetical protein
LEFNQKAGLMPRTEPTLLNPEELEELFQQIQNVFNKTIEAPEKSAVVLDLRNTNDASHELLKLAVYAYQNYCRGFSSQSTALALIGNEDEIKAFIQSTGLTPQFAADQPEQIMNQLKGYTVKIFTHKKEDCMENAFVILFDNSLPLPDIHKHRDKMIQTFQLFMSCQ